MKKWCRRTCVLLSALLILGTGVEPLYAAEVSGGMGAQIEVIEDVKEGAENAATVDDALDKEGMDDGVVDKDASDNGKIEDGTSDKDESGNGAIDDGTSANENNTTDDNTTDDNTIDSNPKDEATEETKLPSETATEEKQEGTEQTEDEETETDSPGKLRDELDEDEIKEKTNEENILLEETIEESGIITNPLYDIDEDAAIREIQTLEEQALGSSFYASIRECSSVSAAADYVRGEMVARSNSISFLFPQNLYYSNVLNDIRNNAVTHTESCSGQEGDALQLGWKAYSGNVAIYSGNLYKITMTLTYYTDYEQESALTKAVNNAMNSLALGNESKYNKIKAIHDYICDHVDYDYTYSKYSAYEALCTGSSVCQGYAVLFYRMCKEAGLSVRVITGTGNGGRHAWNIVKIGSYYYNVDCTWDGQDTTTYDTWLLKCEADFPNHSREEDYATPTFYNMYPMSPTSWIDENAIDSAYQLDNLLYTYTTIDGNSVSSTAMGKPKLLVFFRTTCWNSRQTIQEICDKNIGGVDMIAVEIDQHGRDDVVSFRDTYGNNTMLFSYSTSSDANASMWSYLKKVGISSSVTLPVLVYIDSNNKIQYVSQGLVSGAEVSRNLAQYCGIKALSLAESSVNMTKGDTYKITVYVNGEPKNGSAFKWFTSNSSVAIVDANGKVTGTGAGNCVITCEMDGTKATLNIKVAATAGVKVEKITLDSANVTLNVGKTYTLKAVIVPDYASNKGLTWSSSNSRIVTVDSNGKITAVAAGTATISATAKDGSGKKASCNVTVSNSGWVHTSRGWQKINGTWYYFESDGTMKTGWLKLGSTWYYLNGSGAMQTGWLKLGNTWYYLNGSGAMQIGWLKLNNTWYYFNSNGAMATGNTKISGKMNRFDSSGAWKGTI